ncbi:hypothetical protein DPMN_160178 [Dreissena polymorpha]|uniref:Uncharacterized protein n=1 Tax=Dreissena polymorpha TaxID=45954 RepID=A0A9D4EQL8_DREPO|nr:hypothetical protein DPMN_160178 [Dreissena polymorpha]
MGGDRREVRGGYNREGVGMFKKWVGGELGVYCGGGMFKKHVFWNGGGEEGYNKGYNVGCVRGDVLKKWGLGGGIMWGGYNVGWGGLIVRGRGVNGGGRGYNGGMLRKLEGGYNGLW